MDQSHLVCIKGGSFHDIVNVTDCQIVDEDYRKILDCTLEAARESGLLYYHRMRHTGYFRHLLVRKAVKTEEILVDLVTTTETECTGISGYMGEKASGIGTRW